MSRIPIGWVVTLVVAVLLVVGVLAFRGHDGGTGGSRTAAAATQQAANICAEAQSALAQLPQSPGSITAALHLEHRVIAIDGRELSRLEALAPQESDSFQAGVAKDRKLLHGFSSMVARPDFVRLSLTLPGHPDRAPAWLNEWLAREQQLHAEAHTDFSQAEVPVCEKSLG